MWCVGLPIIFYESGAVFSYKLRYIVGFWLVEMAISTNQKLTIYRNLYENTGPEHLRSLCSTNPFVVYMYTEVKIQKAVSAYFTSRQTLQSSLFVVIPWNKTKDMRPT